MTTPSPSTPSPAARPPGRPGFGSVSALAFAFILVPGMAVYVALHAVGLAMGPAGLLGLLVMFLCLGFYPSLLVRLGWVPPRRRRPAASPAAPPGPPPGSEE